MTRKLLVCATALLLSATTAMAQGGKFTIKGTVENADGETVYLHYGNQAKPMADSTVVKKGKFTFKGMLDKPYSSARMIIGQQRIYNRDKILTLSLEPGKVTVKGTRELFGRATVTGGKTQQERNEFEASLAENRKQVSLLNQKYQDAKDAAEREAIKAQIEPYSKQVGEAQRLFYTTHPDSYLSPEMLRYDMSRMSYQELKTVYDSFSDRVKQYGECSTIVEELNALEKVQTGKSAPDFMANDINGRPFTLSSLRGKVVIIDFWASWCVPCRKSNPHMRELYKKYHPKGLDLVYVSDDDSRPAAWKKAVADDKLVGEGYHHVLRGLKVDRSNGQYNVDKTNDISDKYAIHYLPTKYLIDREGRIVCKVENDEQLERELERLLGKAEYDFTINGTAPRAEGKQVTLYCDMLGGKKELSTTVKDGRFSLSGKIGQPYVGGVLLLGEASQQDYAQLGIEQGTMTVDIPNATLKEATVKGGKAQDDINAYRAQLKPVEEQLNTIDKQLQKAKTDKQRKQLQAKMDEARKKYDEISKSYYLQHGDSYLAPQTLRMDMGNMSYEEAKKIYDGFSENVKLYGDTEEIERELDALEKIQPGKPAPDFTANDINGKPFTLSSLKGKVVILDFWASWCVPCRKSNPHMKELYEKYHAQGLEMVYVSDDDGRPEAWRKAVADDGLQGDGFHHVLRGFKMDRTTGERDHSNDISDKYAIHYLPTKYLIDREGRIVCKINEGEDQKLDEKLQELLK